MRVRFFFSYRNNNVLGAGRPLLGSLFFVLYRSREQNRHQGGDRFCAARRRSVPSTAAPAIIASGRHLSSRHRFAVTYSTPRTCGFDRCLRHWVLDQLLCHGRTCMWWARPMPGDNWLSTWAEGNVNETRAEAAGVRSSKRTFIAKNGRFAGAPNPLLKERPPFRSHFFFAFFWLCVLSATASPAHERVKGSPEARQSLQREQRIQR